MTLPLLIAIAIATPFVVLGVLWLFAKEVAWLAPRPRLRGFVYVGWGVILLAYAAWRLWNEGLTLGSALFLLVAISNLGLGAHDIRRGEGLSLE